MNTMRLHHGDCLEVMRAMPSNSVDSIVTDPPYGLSFMGKHWDYDVPGVDIWAECLRVLKPGGHLLAFAGTRTQHRMAVRIEDAGFEIRDMIAWVYGSGFPKSLDVSKAIDKAAGVAGGYGEKKPNVHSRGDHVLHEGWKRPWQDDPDAVDKSGRKYLPGSEAARQWEGWGTALKPALEPITMARKPLAGTVAANVLEHGTGALNIDGCRVPTDPTVDDPRLGGAGSWGTGKMAKNVYEGGYAGATVGSSPLGRWPANLIHDGSDEVVAGFPGSNGSGPARKLNRSAKPEQQGWGMNTTWADTAELRDAGTGSAARFFYAAKASKKDRDEGLDGMPVQARHTMSGGECIAEGRTAAKGKASARNHHPTVKPTVLMRYLCRLVTPPGGVVLDPFMGSGSTGKAALREGFHFVGIEREAEYLRIAQARISAEIAATSAQQIQPPREDLFSGILLA